VGYQSSPLPKGMVLPTKKRVEKLRYIHRNPVRRGLVESPEQWRWSSYQFYPLRKAGLVRVNEGWGEDFVPRSGGVVSHVRAFVVPALRKMREEPGTHRVGGGNESQQPGAPAFGFGLASWSVRARAGATVSTCDVRN